MPMGVTPIGFRVLVEKLETRSLGAIQLPENSTENVFHRFKVVAVGTPRITTDGREVPIPVQVGDEIMFNVQKCVACGPADFFDGRDLIVVDVDGILAVFKGNPGTPKRKIVTAHPVPELVH